MLSSVITVCFVNQWWKVNRDPHHSDFKIVVHSLLCAYTFCKESIESFYDIATKFLVP
jgi:hypothetical protein